jgi:D-alanine-D-alanine ligase
VRVVILFNRPVLPADHHEYGSEEWVCCAVADAAEVFAAAGFAVSQLGLGREFFELPSRLADLRPDVVFNLFEGLADQPQTEVTVARLLEQMQVPFTGSGSRALDLALNKHRTKRCLRAAGLPTPWFRLVSEPPPDEVSFPWPVIVKPAKRDASEGINQSSVVTTPPALARQVRDVLDQYGPPVLIEQFLAGREFTVSLVEVPQLAPLPITEILFKPSAVATWPIFDYAGKWHPGTPEYEATATRPAVPLPSETSARLISLATRAYRAIGCRDYARIDLRMTTAGEPMILEVNTNPDMNPTACFAVAMEAGGFDRPQLLARFVRQAAARGNCACKTLGGKS